MKPDFANMTKDEAVQYCYRHKKEFIRDAIDADIDPSEATEQFDCLIEILDGCILPSQLPDYGMDYEDSQC